MKEAQGKFGGSFFGTMVNALHKNARIIISSSLCIVYCTFYSVSLSEQLARLLKLEILTLRLLLSG